MSFEVKKNHFYIFNKIKNYLINKLYIKLKKFFRFSSFPFVSGDSFRKICDHIYDEDKNFNPEEVQSFDKVFVKSDLIEEFFKLKNDLIVNKYILLTHNSDRNIDEKFLKFRNKNLIHWFAQNLSFDAHNYSIIPIGFENRWRFKNGKLTNLKKDYSKNTKVHYIFSSFSEKTNEQRTQLNLITEEIDTIYKFKSSKNYIYLKELSKSMYNLCPEGNGLDTHRIWESLLVNTIPIVKLNKFSSNFQKIGIPMLYLEDWNDLKKYDKDSLDKIYMSLTKENNLNKYAQLSFWTKYMEERINYL